MKLKKAVSLLLAGTMAVTTVFTTSATASAADNYAVEQSSYEIQDLVKYVNPLIGSNNFKGNSEFAGLAPYVTSPFGMTNFTPQTRQNRIGGISYLYKDTKFKGFFATHQPAIWMGDYGYVNVMPQIGDITPDENGRALTFDYKTGSASGNNAENKKEVSTPYYYKAEMGTAEGKPITAEMTATERCAVYHFTYPENNASKFYVESARDRGNGQITIDEEKGEIYGWNNDNMSSHLNNKPPQNLKGYFVIQFDKKLNGKGTYSNYQTTEENTTASGQKSGAYVTFDTAAGETVEVKIGTSFVSVEQARKNLEQEVGEKDFDTIKEELKEIWNEKMNIIQIEGATESEKTIFYTAMFHALLYPRTFYEIVDGKEIYYSPFDDKYHEGRSYTDFSLWDTFRAQNSFMTLVVPERVDDMINSLLQTFKEGGYMPKWPNPNYTNIMIGTHADSLVAEAINKGFDGFDYDLAYEAVLKDAMVPQEGDGTIKWQDRQSNVPYEARGGLSAYKALGYIPNQYAKENVSRTIEFAYDDWCAAQVAKAVGKDNEAKYFLNRSMNYKNVISPETGYAMGRDADGNWTTAGQEFTEGDGRKFTWFAPQDPQGLLDYMTENKGENFYNDELQKAFGGLGGSKWIEHQNEPCHHYGYMFDFSGRPDLTQKYVRQTLVESYTDDTNGELGNDDCGQMSAWYVFSAMGFYPVNPASGEYMIGSPIFDKVTIHNPGTGKDFVLTAPDNDGDNYYIQSAKLNGEALDIPVITYDQITNGAKVDFVMGNTASDWAADYRKEAIKYDETAESPKDDTKPPFFGNGEVVREEGKNITEGAKVSATHWAIPSNANDLGDPATSLIDGNYDFGYVSDPAKDMSKDTLAKDPYYITMEWETPRKRMTSLKMWSNYANKQAPKVVDIEVKGADGEWKTILEDITLEWADEAGGDHRNSTKLSFDAQKNVSGLRIRVKEGNLSWGKIAVRELEVFEDYSTQIGIDNPSDYEADIIYRGNTLEQVLFDGKELVKGKDYTFSGDKNEHITIFGETLIANGANANAELRFVFSQGDDYVEKLVIWDGWRANLESLIAKTKAIDESEYTQATVENLKAAAAKAEELLKTEADDEALEEMSNELQKAFDELVPVISAYERIEFENADSITTDKNPDNGRNTGIENADGGQVMNNTFDGAWYQFDGVKFGNTAPKEVTVRYSGANNCFDDARVEIRLGNKDGELIASVNTPKTGAWSNYTSVTAVIDAEAAAKLKGTHPICLVLKGTRASGKTYVGNFNWVEFTPGEETAEPEESDKVWLAALIEYAESQQENEDYQYVVPVIKKAFEAALAEAVAVNENAAATQAEVDAAYDKLLNMTHYLGFTGNSTSLRVLADAAKALNEKLYTADSWAVLADALAKAEAVLADENALQAEIDVAAEVLQAAMDALVKNPVDKSKLQKLVDKAKKYEDAIKEYTPATGEIFQGALDYAREVLANADAAQEEVDAAYTGLQNAIFGLRLIPDKGKLEDLIKDAEAVDTADYTAESAAAFTAALDNAKAVFTDANATEEDVKAAEKALKKAQKDLVAKADADKKGNDKVASADDNSKPAAKTGDAATALPAAMAGFAALAAVIASKKRRQ